MSDRGFESLFGNNNNDDEECRGDMFESAAKARMSKLPSLNEGNFPELQAGERVVTLFKWDWPSGHFADFMKKNVDKSSEFYPFSPLEISDCNLDPYNKGPECWGGRGPLSLFVGLKMDFDTRFMNICSFYKTSLTDPAPPLEILRRLKNSMLGYNQCAAQRMYTFETRVSNLVAPCQDGNCRNPPHCTNGVLACGIPHLDEVVRAQGIYPFTGLGYTYDITAGRRGDPPFGVREFILPQADGVFVTPIKHYGEDYLVELWNKATSSSHSSPPASPVSRFGGGRKTKKRRKKTKRRRKTKRKKTRQKENLKRNKFLKK